VHHVVKISKLNTVWWVFGCYDRRLWSIVSSKLVDVHVVVVVMAHNMDEKSLVIMLLISGYGRDLRCTQSKAYALDCPDESLASLSCISTLMSFGWSSPVTPEKTFILLNDLPLDEQLISSLPETPGVRFRVKKETVAAGSESGGTESGNVDENRSDESPKQVILLNIATGVLFIKLQNFDSLKLITV